MKVVSQKRIKTVIEITLIAEISLAVQLPP